MSKSNSELDVLDGSSSIKGEPSTGFEKRGDKGPFECWNCSYYDAKTKSCGEEHMVDHSSQPRVSNGRRVSVHGLDCCEFVDRIGKKGEPNESEQ